jgi:prepilin-type processing-associated H-X9-DG protein
VVRSGELVFPGKTHFRGAVKVFACPADTDRVSGDDVSYMVNELTFSEDDQPRRWTIGTAKNAASTVYAMDWWTRNDESKFTGSTATWSTDCWPHYKHMWSKYMDAHQAGCNILFMDGHVAHYLKPAERVLIDRGGQKMVINDLWEEHSPPPRMFPG